MKMLCIAGASFFLASKHVSIAFNNFSSSTGSPETVVGVFSFKTFVSVEEITALSAVSGWVDVTLGNSGIISSCVLAFDLSFPASAFCPGLLWIGNISSSGINGGRRRLSFTDELNIYICTGFSLHYLNPFFFRFLSKCSVLDRINSFRERWAYVGDLVCD